MADEIERIDLAPGHVVTILRPPDRENGGGRYTCTCRKLVDGDVEAAHYHADLVTP